MKLAELIRTLSGGRSYEQLEQACGGTPTRQRLQQITTSDIKAFPSTDTIAGLARGLSVSTRAVVLAAAESLGIDVSTGQSRLETLLPGNVDALSDAQVAAVLQTIRTFLPEPTKPAAPNVDTTLDRRRSKKAFVPPPMPDLTEPYESAANTVEEPTVRELIAEGDPENYPDDPSPDD